MLIIGLTGPSGSGKTTLCDIAKEMNVESIDADKVYHALLVPPSPCLDELVESFGDDILTPYGTLDRAMLGRIVFSDETKKKLSLLNRITHKYVKARFRELLAEYKAKNERVVIVDAPTLFESGFDSECTITVALLSDEKLRRERIISRDALSGERADARLSAQKSDEFFISRANYTVYNDGDTDSLSKAFRKILIENGGL